MADIFKEVDEDVRRDQMLRFWRKYRTYIVAAAVLLLIGTAAGLGWREWRESQRLAESAEFVAALALLEQGRNAEAGQALATFAEKARPGYAALARLREAGARLAGGERARAVATLDALAADATADTLMREVAALLAAVAAIDDGAPADVAGRLTALSVDSKPFRHLAREMQAVLALRTGDLDGARKIYIDLAQDAAAPSGVRERAGEVLASLASPKA